MTTHPTPQTVDLTGAPLPGYLPIVEKLDLAERVLMHDPQDFTSVKAERNRLVFAGPENVAMLAWIDRRLELHEATTGVDGVRSWYGVIEGVPVRVDLGGAR